MLSHAKANIDAGLADLLPATSSIRWFFSSSKQKQQALRSYEMLTSLMEGYGKTVQEHLAQLAWISRTTEQAAWHDFSVNSIQFYNILEEINPGIFGTDDAIYGLPEDLAREIQDQCFFPEGLLCELRRYQEWGVKYALHQERVLLGDEMGLGKTIQAIATMVSLKIPEQPTLWLYALPAY